MRLNGERASWGIISMLSLGATFFVLFLGIDYSLMAFLPLAFFICNIVIFPRLILSLQSKIARYFQLFSFVRYVALPVMMIISENFSAGQSGATPYLNLTVILMVWELFATAGFMAFYTKTKGYLRKRNALIEMSVKNIYENTMVFWFFILFAGGMLLLFPESLSHTSFVFPRITAGQEEDASTGIKLTVYVLSLAKNILFIICIMFFKRQYDKNKNTFYYPISILAALLNVVIFFGTGRIAVMLSAFASMMLINRIYPQKQKTTNIFIVSMVIVVIVIISISRNVMMGVSNREDIIYALTSMIDAYLGGIYNVGISIKMSKQFSNEYATLNSFIQEFLRFVIGISIFLKKSTIQTSSILFNLVFSSNRSNVGQIIPIIGVGYFYFGFLMAPIFEIFFLYIGLKLEKKLYNQNKFDAYVFYCISSYLLRIGMISGQNPQLLTSNFVSYIIIPLMISKLNEHIFIRRKVRKN